MAELLKQRNFSAFDLSKLNASLYDMKVARGTDEYLARFVGWESRKTGAILEDVALFAVRTDQGEKIRKLAFDGKVSDQSRLKMLFALGFAARPFETEEWTPTHEELEKVK